MLRAIKKFFLPEMDLLLSLDASADFCSAAIHKDGELIAAEHIELLRSAAAQLGPAVERVMKTAAIKGSALSAVAVAAGPGSYTGLRMVTSLAKGMCSALDIPLIAVDTLDVMMSKVAFSANVNFYCPTLDARRNEIYYKMFDHTGHIKVPTSCLIVEKESLSDFLNEGRILFFGSGADKTVKILSHANALIQDGVLPDAMHAGQLAYKKWLDRDFVSRSDFEPFYLKEFMVGRKPEKN